MQVKEQVEKLLAKAGEGIWEKEQLLALSLLSAVAGESIFLLGPPGTAKSMIARRLKEMFKEKRCFEYLMSRFSTPDEIFGPVSIQKLKDEDCYKRNVEGFLPWATVVFLDEIWKAGPAIQNALLTVLNEKIYQNGAETINLPVKGIIAASNELPAEGQGLEALWDRFLIRAVSNCISDEETFYNMMMMHTPGKVQIEDKLLLTDETIAEWQEKIEDVEVDRDILLAITYIRKKLKEKGAEEDAKPLDYYVSDRRWRKILHLLKTSAFLNGRNKVDASDLLLLVHVLWNNEKTIPTIVEITSHAVYSDLMDEVAMMDKHTKSIVSNMARSKPGADEQGFKVVNLLYYNIENYADQECLMPKADYKFLQPNRDINGITYFDSKLGCQVLRRYDAMSVFKGQNLNAGTKNVRLRKTAGGIIIDKMRYPITREDGETDDFTSPPSQKELETMLHRLEEIKQTVELRTKQISDSKNLFISHEDSQLSADDRTSISRTVDELIIRITGGLLI